MAQSLTDLTDDVWAPWAKVVLALATLALGVAGVAAALAADGAGCLVLGLVATVVAALVLTQVLDAETSPR